MTRALIVSDVRLTDRDPERLARLHQMTAFYRDREMRVDLLLIGAQGPVKGIAPPLPDGIERIGVLPGNVHDVIREGGSDALSDAVQAIAAADSYQVVHSDGLACAISAAAVSVIDARDGNTPWAGSLPEADLVLAASEPVRGQPRFAGLRSVRLPMTCRAGLPSTDGGQMIGWPSPVAHDLAEGWARLLHGLAARGQRIDGGLMLGTVDGTALPVPPLLRRTHASPAGYPLAAARRALGLAVLPSVPGTGFLYEITCLVAGSCPVLVPRAVAEHFEDRWQLPVFEDHQDLIAQVQRWINGRGRSALAEAAVTTRAMLEADVSAMTQYCHSVLSELLV